MAQVAGQQGAYVARMINGGYTLGLGGLAEPFPCRRKAPAGKGAAAQACLPRSWDSSRV